MSRFGDTFLDVAIQANRKKVVKFLNNTKNNQQ